MPSNDKLLEIIEFQSAIAKQGQDLSEVMNQVVLRSLNLTRADGAAIEFTDGEDMVYRAASGCAGPYLGLRLKRETSLSGLCIREHKIQCCADTENDERVDRQATRSVGVRAMICVPLFHNEEAVGVLKVMSTTPHHFTDEDCEVLNLLSDVVASAMYFGLKLCSTDLHYLATHDCLVQLPNRSLFMERLHRATANRRREREHCAVLMVDMNGLKSINDHYGHWVGDEAIKETAQRLAMATRSSDTVARLGGDEFGIIVTPLAEKSCVDSVIERIHDNMTSRFECEDIAIDLSVSVGDAVHPFDATCSKQLLKIADSRMYQNKRFYYSS